MNFDVIKNLIWKFSERMLAQVVTFVVSIVLARLLSPAEYGTIALVMVFITIADVFANAGFGNALIQKLHVDNVDYSSVLYLSLGISFIIYGILFISAPYIADFYNSASLCKSSWYKSSYCSLQFCSAGICFKEYAV